jgi:phage terminase large subunit-like protein
MSTPDPDALVRPHLENLAALRTPAERAEYRRRVTERDPLLFGLLYLRRHLTAEDGSRSLSEVHVAWAKSARKWMKPQTKPMRSRRAEVAPRNMGKSTWWFLILPMWAAAHGHRRFAAAFADTDTQAQTHLATFKAELDTNALIRADYPDLVEPKTRGRGTVMADRVSLYHARSGFVFAAAGMDSANLGMKVGDRRPDLLILDDIEPHEARYSATLADKRLATLREAILPLNIYAHVILVGTVTMQGSIVHQVVKRARGDFEPDDGTEWVDEERITARHWMPLLVDDDGERRSIWPAKWSVAFLESIEHTRSYAKNYANDPLGADGDYWQLDDFRDAPEDVLAAITHEVISVDPAVTSKASSDATALAAVGWSRAVSACAVYEVRAVRLQPDDVRLTLLAMIERALGRGHAVLVIVETNQGGDLWRRIFHDLPVRVKTFTSTAPKPVRAADALDHYQRRRVYHVRSGPGVRDAEGEMVAFPRAPHDDRVDAVGAGVRYFLSRDKKRPGGVVVESVTYA